MAVRAPFNGLHWEGRWSILHCLCYFLCWAFKRQVHNWAFCLWNKKSEKVKEHKHCLYHQSSLEQVDHLKQRIQHPHTSIVAHAETHKAANVKCNHAALMSTASAVLICGLQCIALRGDTEKLDDMDLSSDNPGNFLALLKLLAVHDDVLHTYLEPPLMRCTTYTSPWTHTELIVVMESTWYCRIHWMSWMLHPTRLMRWHPTM